MYEYLSKKNQINQKKPWYQPKTTETVVLKTSMVFIIAGGPYFNDVMVVVDDFLGMHALALFF